MATLATSPAADRRYAALLALSLAAARQVLRMWDRSPVPVLDSFDPLPAARLVAGLQLAAAQQADPYVVSALAEQGVTAPAAGALVPMALAGVAGDGRSLLTLLDEPRIKAKILIGSGVHPVVAFERARESLQKMAVTAVQDAGRAADGVAMVTRPAVAGYERVVNLPACGRCIVLAGRVYRWSDGFLRHPRCDCSMVPVTEVREPGATPEQLFERMTPEQQDKAFTKAGAQAIRDGADIGQVVNARRGMSTAAGVLTTTESTTRRGSFRGPGPRLMPEAIYQIASDRNEAIRLLRRFGYIV